MTTGERSQSWWQTLPGVITAATAIITALSGLIVAINQTGWFAARPAAVANSAPRSSAHPGASAAADATPTTQNASSPSPAARAISVELPALREYQLGGATFALLAADLSPRTTENDQLRVRLRMLNHERYDANFWDNAFRLLVNNVPTAPISGLNEVVPGQSAKEGDVLFVIPHGTPSATLVLTHGNDSTNIHLPLSSPPGMARGPSSG